MLILLCYFVVFTSELSVHIIVSIQQTQPVTEGIYAYFLCQLNGANPNCDELQEEFRQYLTPNVTTTTFIMIGLINWVYLIFPFHYKDVEFIISRVTNNIHRLYKSSFDSTVRSRNNSTVQFVAIVRSYIYIYIYIYISVYKWNSKLIVEQINDLTNVATFVTQFNVDFVYMHTFTNFILNMY